MLKNTETEELIKQARAKVSDLSILKVSTVIYGAMALVGLGVIHFGHESLSSIFALEPLMPDNARLLLIAGLVAGLLLIMSYFFEDWFASYRELKISITSLLGPLSVSSTLYLALVSSIGEELLFRGAIQPYAGLVVTSILFCFLHLGQDGKISAWSIWAVIAGLLMGWTYEQTSSLWPAVISHFIVNTTSILMIRRSYQNLQKQLASKSKATL